MSEQKITISNGVLNVPDQPVVPFIEGDGTGVDIWPAAKNVIDSAVAKAYNGGKQENGNEPRHRALRTQAADRIVVEELGDFLRDT